MPNQRPDLQKILKRVQKRYFPKCRDLPVIGWKYPSRTTDNCCTYGMYRPDENFIYVNFALAAKFVPEYFLEYIVYHELCHHMQDEEPIRDEAAHSDRFHTWEIRYKAYDRACDWEKTHISQVVREINRLARKLRR